MEKKKDTPINHKFIVMRIIIPLMLVLCSVNCIAQNVETKIIWAKADSLNAKMTTSDKDDIYFNFYDKKMNKIIIDSISGDCKMIFLHGVDISLTTKKIDSHTLQTTLEDFNGYIKFVRCELNILYYHSKIKFVFINN